MNIQRAWVECALSGLLLLLVPAGAKGDQPGGWPDPACSAIQITSTPRVGRLTKVPSFSTRQVLDLNFTILFPVPRRRGLPRQDVESLELRLFTPNGHLYQSTTVPIALAARKKRTVEGYPHPLPVAQLLPYGQGGLASGFAVTAPSFPVAGTLIVADSLYGVWRVEAWPDGGQRACSARFSLRP
jgi:hypothetical protein